MTQTTSESRLSKTRLLSDLETLRGSARLQAHLLGMDARESWRKIEEKLNSAEHLLDVESHGMADAAIEKLAELTRAARELFRKQSLRAPELASPVSSIMQRSPVSCQSTDTLDRVAQLMWEQRLGALPVVDADGRVAGMVTDRDACMGAYTQGRRLGDICVDSVMSPEPICARHDSSLRQVLDLMLERGLSRIPIVDEEQRLVSVVSVSDVIQAIYDRTGGLQVAAPALVQILCRDEGST